MHKSETCLRTQSSPRHLRVLTGRLRSVAGRRGQGQDRLFLSRNHRLMLDRFASCKRAYKTGRDELYDSSSSRVIIIIVESCKLFSSSLSSSPLVFAFFRPSGHSLLPFRRSDLSTPPTLLLNSGSVVFYSRREEGVPRRREPIYALAESLYLPHHLDSIVDHRISRISPSRAPHAFAATTRKPSSLQGKSREQQASKQASRLQQQQQSSNPDTRSRSCKGSSRRSRDEDDTTSTLAVHSLHCCCDVVTTLSLSSLSCTRTKRRPDREEAGPLRPRRDALPGQYWGVV